MQIGRIVIDPWNKRNFLPRIIAIALIVGWIAWGLIILREGRQLEEAFEQMQLKQQQQEERLRRAAAYDKSRLEDKLNRRSSKNAVDDAKR